MPAHTTDPDIVLGGAKTDVLMSDATDAHLYWSDGDRRDPNIRSKSRRRSSLHRSSSLSCRYETPRIGLASSTLSLAVENSSTESDGLKSVSSEKSFSFRSMSFEKKITFINFCTTNLCVGCFYSLLGPFFPTEAAKKGVNTTFVGLIFGVFELVVVLASPIFGTFLTRIGAKFTYAAGVFVCGGGAILFGFLDESPDGTTYIVLCFTVRVVEALGAAALSTASFAILANTFPDNVATVFGTLELFTGLGLMIGPPVGGALFQLGGFMLPFISLGCAMMIVCLITIIILPSQTVIRQSSSGSMLSLLRIPIVFIMGVCLMSGSASIGFIDVTLAIYLKDQYGLSPVALGFVFLVGPGMYAITAPIWGWVVDKTPRFNKVFIFCGYTLGGIAFYLMGPAPFLNIPHMLWLVIVSLAMMGIGIGTLVITFQVMTEATMAAGYPDGLDTYGLIAGVFNSFFSFGAFIGPLGGGYLHDLLEFELSAVVIGSCSAGAALLLLMYMIIAPRCGNPTTEPLPLPSAIDIRTSFSSSERQPLLKNSSTDLHRYIFDHERVTPASAPDRTTRSTRDEQQSTEFT